MTARTTSDGMSLQQSASTGIVRRGGGWFFLGGGQRAVRGLLVSAGSGPAGLVVWSARLAAPRAGRARNGVGEGVSRWRVFFGRWPARCARVAGQRGLGPAGRVVWSARLASPRAGRGRVAWGRACRGGRVFFWGGGGQRAVRGSLVSAGLGPRAVLCGAHDSLRLVLAGGGWRGGGRVAVAGSFFGGAVASALCAGRWSARAWARGSCCVERTTRCTSCWQGREVAWRGWLA